MVRLTATNSYGRISIIDGRGWLSIECINVTTNQYLDRSPYPLSGSLTRAGLNETVAFTGCLGIYSGTIPEVEVTLYWGLRPGGILHVRHSLTRERGGKWRLTDPKTAKSRRILPLTSLGLDALQRARVIGAELRLQAGERWEDNDLVFPTRNGTSVREAQVLAEFPKELKRAGLPRRRRHDLRHTFATQLFALNKHPRAVQDLLGHSHVNTTLDVYTGSVSGVVAEAIGDLDRAIRMADELAG